MILCFQCLYYKDDTYALIQKLVVPEYFFVFLPYYCRFLFPKTSFRDSLNSPTNKSKDNHQFFLLVGWVTKIFYVWAKHFIGFFLNYVRFSGRITEEDQRHMFLLLLFSGFATTVSMFLHTLKFKGLLKPRTSYLIYMASYLATFYSILQLRHVFWRNGALVVVTVGV